MRRIVFAIALLPCALVAARRAAAQNDTLPDIWRVIVRDSSGARLAIDSLASIPLETDSTFSLRLQTVFAQPVALGGGSIDRELYLGRVDCRNGLELGLAADLLLGDSLAEVQPLPNRWAPPPPERKGVVDAVCASLLRGYTPAPHPVPGERRRGGHEDQPELGDFGAVHSALERAYPPALRRARVPGQVTARFRVLADGRVDARRIDVLEATRGFAQAARTVVAGMRFRPARINGKPVPVWVQLPVSFNP